MREGGPRNPHMMRWYKMMIRVGGSLVDCFFTWDIFSRSWKLLVFIEDYTYARMDYREDPEIPRPPRQVWGPDGTYTSDAFVVSFTCSLLV